MKLKMGDKFITKSNEIVRCIPHPDEHEYGMNHNIYTTLRVNNRPGLNLFFSYDGKCPHFPEHDFKTFLTKLAEVFYL